MLDTLHPRVSRRAVVQVAGHPTPVKTRILAGGVHSAKQQVVRIDRGVNQDIDARARAAFERATLAAIGRADAILISDYGSGLVTPAFVSKLRSLLRREGMPIPVLVVPSEAVARCSIWPAPRQYRQPAAMRRCA